MTSPLIVSVPTTQLATALAPLPEGVELVLWPMDGPPPREDIDLVVPPYMNTSDVYDQLTRVRARLVQGQSIGYEEIARLLPPGQVFANASSVHETSTAELALALTLGAQRELPAFVRAQDAGRWETRFTRSLADSRVMLLGYGGVGTAVGARLSGFEAEIVAVARTARDEDGVHVHGIGELAELLPTVDIVIASLPGGGQTSGMIDDAFLAALPDGALVVNVGRGPLIDTDALVDHVRRGRIRAALDVTDPEPLPEAHPLWTLPGVLISPHVGGASTAMLPRVVRLVRTQAERMLAGEEPLNVVLRS